MAGKHTESRGITDYWQEPVGRLPAVKQVRARYKEKVDAPTHVDLRDMF